MSVSKVYTRASLGVEAPSICVETLFLMDYRL